MSAYNFTISYRKGLENTRADALSRREDYAGKPTERARAILKKGENGLEYNHELLATISIVEDDELTKRIQHAYDTDESATRVRAQPTEDFDIDQQGLLRFKGLVYIPTKLRKEFVRE